MKKCKICGHLQSKTNFHKAKTAKDGLDNRCKECSKAIRNKYYKDNKTLIKKYRKDNPWIAIYSAMKSRCLNKNNKAYKNYGGRGVKLLITQKEVKSLWERDKATTLKNPTIDRKDNNGNYSLLNCRFITQKENNQNNRNSKVWILFGKTYNSLSEACKGTEFSQGKVLRWCNNQKNGCFSAKKYSNNTIDEMKELNVGGKN